MPSRPGSGAPLDVPSDIPSDFFEKSTTGVPPAGPGEPGKPPPRLGPYAVGALLGRGGMGEVYRARHASLGRDVALKLLAPGAPAELRTRFLREARTAARLRHPNIVTVHDAGEEGGYAWIAMDLVEGRSAATMLRDETLDARRAAVIAEKIARALAHAHAEGVIHRDVKPGNILLDASGEPRLADFGLARDVGHSAGLSRPGVTLGTPSYMPPEQAAGKLGTVDGRSDVWSLGACLHEMLTGSPAFDGETPLAIMAKVLADDPPPVRRLVPQVSRDLETIVSRCLEKDPNRRYAGAQALADDLGRFLRSNPIAARRVGPLGRLARRARRNPLPFVLGAAAALLGLATGTVLVARAAAERGERGSDLFVARELTPTDPRRAQGILARWAEKSPGDPEIAAALAAAEASARALATGEARAAARVHLLRADEERRAFREATERLTGLGARRGGDGDPAGGGSGPEAPAEAPVEDERERVAREREAAYARAWGFLLAARNAAADLPASEESSLAADGLADLARERLREAEEAGDAAEAARFLEDLRAYGAARYARDLEGTGTLTLDTSPSGAEVLSRPLRDEAGRLVPGSPVALGTTPLRNVAMPMGPALLVLRKPGFPDVPYPVLIERCEIEVVPEPVPLLTAAQIGEGYVYVPPGEAILGGDRSVPDPVPRRRRHVRGFLLARHEVTVEEYRAFLAARLARGEAPEAVQARCPRESPNSAHFWFAGLGGIEERQRFPDDWPVFGISSDDATAYAAWRSEVEGRRVRLPEEDEWERAARGADGRAYPWGSGFRWSYVVPDWDPARREALAPTPVGTVEADASPFGVRDLAGGVLEWCADEHPGSTRAARGGGRSRISPRMFRCAYRSAPGRSLVYLFLGFRVAAEPRKP